LTKPFGVRELVARARALVRRPRGVTPPPAAAAAVRLGPVIVDPARRSVTVDGRAIELTALEFDLLYLLASHPGIVFSREALVSRVWRSDTHVTERSVDTLIKRLRRKIERDPTTPERLLTVWGAGYKAADV
jgi:DNA-binding response OmpR family regulator